MSTRKLLLLLSLILTCIGVDAAAQEPGDSALALADLNQQIGRPARRRDQHERMAAKSMEDLETPRSEDGYRIREGLGAGYVILNGEYVPLPYNVEWKPGEIRLNGESIPVPKNHDEDPVSGGQLAQGLGNDEVLLVMGDQAFLIDRQYGAMEFMEYFGVDEARREDRLLQLLDRCPPGLEPDQFQAMVTSIAPHPEFMRRTAEIVRVRDELENEAERIFSGHELMEQIAYPVTVIGMVLCVIGFGHLLAYPPFGFNAVSINADSPIAISAVSRSLVLIAILSALDLSWTMMAARTGQMRELNPLGARMITDPQMLIVFKTAATSLGILLLYFLKKNRPAQVGAWWLCLVLVMLCLRWVSFNSMFVG